jgi:hypothetical protein
MSRRGRPPADVATVRRTLRAHRERLLALPNVRYLAIGRKVKAGTRQHGLSIRVFVATKRSVPRQQRVPSRLRAVAPGGQRLAFYIRTDVEEAPPLRALAPRGGDRTTVEGMSPLPTLTPRGGKPPGRDERGRLRAPALRGGDRIEGRRRGAAALVYRSPRGHDLLLTNAHVVARPDSWAIGEPVDGPTGAGGPVIGRVHRMIRIRTDRTNRWDAALVRVEVPADRLVVGDPPLRVLGYGNLRAAAEGRFFYVSNGSRVSCAYPELVETPVEIDHGGGVSVSYSGFVLLEVTAGMPVPAHSGSLLVGETDAGVLACGLVFAGNTRRVAVTRLRETVAALSSTAASEDDEEEDVRIVF